jgi:hypothetical protein
MLNTSGWKISNIKFTMIQLSNIQSVDTKFDALIYKQRKTDEAKQKKLLQTSILSVSFPTFYTTSCKRKRWGGGTDLTVGATDSLA